MAVAFASSAQGGDLQATTRTTTSPTGTASGDLLIMAFKTVDITSTPGLPTGWNALVPLTKETTDNNWRAIAWWRIADGTATDHPTVAWGGANIFTDYTIARYTGAHATTPIDVAGSWKDNTAVGATAPVDAITTTANNDYLVVIVWNGVGAGMTAASGWTRDADQANGPAVFHRNTTQSPAGSTGTVTMNVSGSNCATLTVMVSVQLPAAGVTLSLQSSATAASGSLSLSTGVASTPVTLTLQSSAAAAAGTMTVKVPAGLTLQPAGPILVGGTLSVRGLTVVPLAASANASTTQMNLIVGVPFAGVLDEPALYGVELTASQVFQHASTVGPRERIARLHFDTGGTTFTTYHSVLTVTAYGSALSPTAYKSGLSPTPYQSELD